MSAVIVQQVRLPRFCNLLYDRVTGAPPRGACQCIVDRKCDPRHRPPRGCLSDNRCIAMWPDRAGECCRLDHASLSWHLESHFIVKSCPGNLYEYVPKWFRLADCLAARRSGRSSPHDPPRRRMVDFQTDLFGNSRRSANAKDAIKYEAKIVPAEAAPGDEVTLQLTATVAPGWHTFSLTQTGFGGSPTVIALDDHGALETAGQRISHRAVRREIHEETLGDTQMRLEEYVGQVTFSRRFQIPADARPGERDHFGQDQAPGLQ